MPIVPRIDAPQVGAAQGPAIRFDAPQVQNYAPRQTMQLGQAAEAAGGELARIVAINEEENIRASAKSRDTQAVEAFNGLQHDPDSGYFNQQGKAAVDGYQSAVKAAQKIHDDALNAATNPREKQILAPILAERMNATALALTKHYNAERNRWRLQSSQDHAEVALRDAAGTPADPIVFAKALDTAHFEVEEQARLNGWDESTTKLRREQYTDIGHKLRYEAWQQTDPAAALADFQKNGRQISPLVRDQIGRKLFTDAAPVLAAQINAAGGVGALSAPAADGSPVPPSRSPRGERNNNPGNLVKGSSPWEGEISGADARFASFATPEHGIRALGKNLLAYQDKHGIDTVEGIISRWAPASENDTRAYVAAVAKAVGVAPGAKIDLHDTKTLTGITKAIIAFENGRQPYTDQQISLGLAAAQGTATLPTAPSATPATATGNPADNAAWRDPAVKTGNPVVDALPPDQKLRVLQLAKTQAHQDTESARTALSIRTRDAQAEYLARGTATNPPNQAEFIRAYGQLEGVARYQELQGVAQLGNQMQQIKTLPEADLRRMLDEAKPAPGEGFAARERNFEILGKAVEQVRKARQDDPIKVALGNPAYGIKPLGRFETVASDLASRGAAMERIARDYGTPPRVMTDFEADQFGTYLRGLQAVDKARVLGEVAGAVGSVGMQSISAQLKDKDSTLAIAGALASRQTTAGNSTARLYLEGKEMLAEKRAKIDATAETGIKAQIFSKLDGVYLSPLARDAAADASLGIYAKLKAEGTDDLERAMRLATGGLMDFNGARIAKPYGWDDARFSDAIRTTVPTSVAAAGGEYLAGGQKIGAKDLARMLPGARLQTFGDGAYLVRAGSDIVRQTDGRPFILTVGR